MAYSEGNISNSLSNNEALQVIVHSGDASTLSSDAVRLDTAWNGLCVCKTEPSENDIVDDVYMCGGCGAYFRTVCVLHKHMFDHDRGGSYIYNHCTRTAIPTFDAVCTGTQTDAEPGQCIVVADDEMLHDWNNEMVDQKKDGNSLNENVSTESINSPILVKQEHSEINENEEAIDPADEATDIALHTEHSEETTSIDQRKPKRRPQRKKRKNKYSSITTSNRTQKTAKKLSRESRLAPVRKRSDAVDSCKINKKIKEEKYPCTFCDKRYSTKQGLQGHCKRTHAAENFTPVKKYNCNWCDQVFDNKDALTQHSTHCEKDERFKCFICHTRNESKETLLQHLVSHRNEADLKCKLCQREFADEILINDHIKRHKLIGRERLTKNQCDKCGRSYLSKQDLRRHRGICGSEPSFECETCHQRFKQRRQLNLHSVTHSDVTPFMCHICGHAAKRKTNLRRHMLVHTGEKPFPCTEVTCDMRFSTGSALLRHRKTHSNLKPCVCVYCGRGFSTNWNLKTHERQHTGAKPYKCPHCGESFKQNVLVKLHIKSHHSYLGAQNSEPKDA